jgi:hypothetical protein
MTKILSPVPRVSSSEAPDGSSRADATDWKRAVILSNDWPAMSIMADAIDRHLQDDHRFTSVARAHFPSSVEMPAEDVDRAAECGDLVILGVAT